MVEHPKTGKRQYQLGVVYCHTDQMQYKGEGFPDGACLLHGGLPSYSRCVRCKDNHGVTSITSDSIPSTVRRVRLVED